MKDGSLRESSGDPTGRGCLLLYRGTCPTEKVSALDGRAKEGKKPAGIRLTSAKPNVGFAVAMRALDSPASPQKWEGDIWWPVNT